MMLLALTFPLLNFLHTSVVLHHQSATRTFCSGTLLSSYIFVQQEATVNK